MIIKKYYKLIRVSHEDSAYFRIKNISNTSGTFSVTAVGDPTAYPSMEYSTDGLTWTNYDFSILPGVAVAAGGNIYLRGDNPNGFQNGAQNVNKYFKFSMDVSHSLGGCIMSLRSKNTPESVTTISNVDFQHLFDGDVNLVYADFNFGNVTTITGGPSDGYGALFGMFKGCTSLITAPDMSTFTSVGNFGLRDCFSGCTALTAGPDLSNITSVGNADGVFGTMFYNCSNLSAVIAPNIDPWSTWKTQNWLSGAGSSVTGTKTVSCPTGVTIPTGSTSGIPTGWTRVDY